LRWDGSQWRQVARVPGYGFTSIDLLSPTDGWALAAYLPPLVQGFWHWDGVEWSQLPYTYTSSYQLSALDMRTDNDGWAVGRSGTTYHWDGTTWTQVPSPTANDLFGVSAPAVADAWAVGLWGTILRWDGGGWISFTSPTSRTLTAVDIRQRGLGDGMMARCCTGRQRLAVLYAR
jgi:hypothetical protein